MLAVRKSFLLKILIQKVFRVDETACATVLGAKCKAEDKARLLEGKVSGLRRGRMRRKRSVSGERRRSFYMGVRR